MPEGRDELPALRARACLLGAALVGGRALLSGRGRAVATVVVMVWASAMIGALAGVPVKQALVDHKARDWTGFHYYLGAKYFAELGYHGLYDQAVAADAEGRRLWRNLEEIRDLRTYEAVPMDYADRERSEVWSDARWEEFREDVYYFQQVIPGRRWRRILRDRGYNATPAGTAVYQQLTRAEALRPSMARLGLIDPALLLVAFVLVGLVFGRLPALLSAAWLLVFFGNEFHVIGGLLQHDYLVAALLAACALKRERWGLAGALVGYAAMVRVFPGLAVAGLVLWLLVRWRIDRRIPRRGLRFAAGLLAAVLLMAAGGSTTGRGPGAWQEWADNIGRHSEHHRFGNKRIGLQHPFTHDWSRGLDWGGKSTRRAAWPDNETAWRVAAVVMLLAWLAVTAWTAARGGEPLDALVFGLVVVFAGIVLSRYYWSIACLFFLVNGRTRDGPLRAWLSASLMAVVAAFYFVAPDIDRQFGQYVWANCLLTAWTLAAMGAWLLDWRRRAAEAGTPALDRQPPEPQATAEAGARPARGLLARLNRAAGGDFEVGAPSSRSFSRKLAVTVGAVALSMLMLEVLLAKVFTFFLGNISAFVAIPVAMCGLSLGALALHWWRGQDSRRLIPLLLPALVLTTLLSFLALFFLFNHVFGLTHYKLQNPSSDAAKTVCLTLVFVPPFAIAGVILSSAFKAAAERVGRLYAVDLAGSAAACLLAPVALHFFDLPVVITLLLATQAVALVVVFSDVRGRLAAWLGAALALLGLLAALQLVFVERPDPEVLGVRYTRDHTVTEVAHRWNEVSRVALLRWEEDGEEPLHRVLHDDGVSNVKVTPYRPERVARGKTSSVGHRLPFLLEEPPGSALVMFAGAGHDMVRLYERSAGELEVTGVEINGRVPWIITRGDDPWKLQQFYDLPGVDLVVDEGRSFLNRDRGSYDLVFVASNGAQQAVRSGHVRKFLDTFEAMEAYLDHLNPGGLLVFHVQPFEYKLEMLKRLFQERDLGDFERSVIVLGRKQRWAATGNLLVKPGGFTPREVDRIGLAWESRDYVVHYAPGWPATVEVFETVRAPLDRSAFVPTDDRPFERPVSFAGFTLFPGPEAFEDLGYSLSWIKVFTMAFFGAIALLTVGAFYGRRRGPRRLPVWLTLYFLATGVCYMLVQIGLMAKLELFMGKPLHAIAVVLAGFLLANGAGSAWVGARQARGDPPSLLLPAVAATLTLPLTLWFADSVLVHGLGLSVWLKAPIALAAVFPPAAVLGTFYPLGVGLTVKRDLEPLVPMTFGLATLSSVVGSTYAMVAMINTGFRAIILQAVFGYACLALIIALVPGQVRLRK